MRGILKQQPGSDSATRTTNFEVRCAACDVTFPTGTKRCMYCGGRPGHDPLFAREFAPDPLGGTETLSDLFQPADPLQPVDAPLEEIEEEEVERPSRSIFRLFGNLTWVILFAALTLYRACTG